MQTQQQQTMVGTIIADPVAPKRLLINTSNGLYYFRPASVRIGSVIRESIAQKGHATAYVDAAYRVFVTQRDGRRIELGLCLGWNRRPFDPLRPRQFGPITAISKAGRYTLYMKELYQAVYKTQIQGGDSSNILAVLPLLDPELNVDGLHVNYTGDDPIKAELAFELTLLTALLPTENPGAQLSK
ncbi:MULTISPECIES: hypothetical protein [Bacteria]|uniref:hypothetical protein n=1 Tax=Pseudomonadati TaxID=3379134 RepID=UPI000223D0E4|nr:MULTISPECIES: hypothetical protein [Bacteria]AEN74734.1 hypothetical protein Rhom172_2854 [Rhodothermus marinus SG0.5JP17-172]